MSVHPRTGYPLLDEDEAVLAVLAGKPLTCASCWWAKGDRNGAPFPDGEDSRWMDARCDYRYTDLMDAEYERDPDIPRFGPGYTRRHLLRGACGSGTVHRPHRFGVDVDPLDKNRCQRWWTDNYPRLSREMTEPACVHWRARGPEMAKIKAGGRGADIGDVWVEIDGLKTTDHADITPPLTPETGAESDYTARRARP